MKKIDFRKGSGTLLYGYMILMTGFIIVLVCVEQFAKYNHTLDTQMAADAIADGTAVYMSMNHGTYEEAVLEAERIGNQWSETSGISIYDIQLSRDDLENHNMASVVVTAEYQETSNADDVFSRFGNAADHYRIQRVSSTRFDNSLASGDFIWVVTGYYYISSPFGYRIHPIRHTLNYHSGIDIPCPANTDVHAIAGGTVAATGYDASMGNYVMINHGEGIISKYYHNNTVLVNPGESVSQGEVIAYSGSTGSSTGPHCHLSVQINGILVDPLTLYGIPAGQEGDVSSYLNGGE